jgi:hypothetical protein
MPMKMLVTSPDIWHQLHFPVVLTLCQLHSRSCQRNNTPIAIINFRCHCALLAQRSAPHDPQQMSATQKEAAPSPPSPPLPHRPTTAHPHPAALLPHCHPRELLRATTPPARTATLYSSCRASLAPCIQALSAFAPPPRRPRSAQPDLPVIPAQRMHCNPSCPRPNHQHMRMQQRKQLRLITVPLAQPALQLGALQQQLVAARKSGLD